MHSYLILLILFTFTNKVTHNNKQTSESKKQKILHDYSPEEDVIEVKGFIKRKKQNKTFKLNYKDLVMRGEGTLNEVLNEETSIQTVSSPKYGTGFQIDGFDDISSAVLFGGIPVSDVFTGHFNSALINTVVLSSVSADIGIPSLAYGPGTTGGIIFLEPPQNCKQIPDQIMLKTGMFYKGKLLYRDFSFKKCKKILGWNAYISGFYKISDGYVLSKNFTPNENNEVFHEDGGIRNGSAETSYGIIAGFSKNTEFLNFNFFSFYTDSPRQIPPFESANYVRYWKYGIYRDFLSAMTVKRKMNHTGLLRNYGFELYFRIHKDILEDTGSPDYRGTTTDPLAWFESSSYLNGSTGLKAEAFFKYKKHGFKTSFTHKTDYHVSYEKPVSEDENETSWEKHEKYVMYTNSLFGDYSVKLKNWNISFQNAFHIYGSLLHEIRGTSYAVNDSLKKDGETRLKLDHRLSSNTLFILKLGRKIRFPLLKELFTNHVGGNPDLKSESALMGSTAFKGKTSIFKWETRLFYYEIKDLIQKYRDSYANIGHALIAGSESRISFDLSGKIFNLFLSSHVRFAYRFLKTLNKDEDRPLDYRSAHKFTASVTNKISKRIRMRHEAIYMSSQQAEWFNTVGGVWIKEYLPGGLILNGAIHFNFVKTKNLTGDLFLEIHNLTDKNYMTGSFEPRPGRFLILGLKGEF